MGADPNMIHDFGPLRARIDRSLHDDTTYSFADELSGDLLTLTCERAPEDAMLGSLVDAKLERLSAVYGPEIEVLAAEEIGTRIGLAACSSARVAAPEPLHICIAYAGSEPMCLQLGSGKPASRLFQHVLRSLAVADDADVHTAPGFVRRAAGRFALDVPPSYRGPDTFRFCGGPIVLECALETGYSWQTPRAAQVAYVDCGRLELESHDGPHEILLDGARALRAAWVFAQFTGGGSAVVERHVVAQLRMDLGDDTTFHARARARSTDAQELARVWDTLLRSVRRKEAAGWSRS
jgi:hypothetical protein